MSASMPAEGYQHAHIFDEGNPMAERRTRWAVLLTVIMMVVEIVGGWVFNSMALLADGWHMSSHALALGLSLLAYAAARRLAADQRFAFGTWKIEVLGGYTSAIFLVAVAGLMLYHSVERLFSPVPIHYNQAIGIAIVGLMTNLACAFLLKDGHDHGHAHAEQHHHQVAAMEAGERRLADLRIERGQPIHDGRGRWVGRQRLRQRHGRGQLQR